MADNEKAVEKAVEEVVVEEVKPKKINTLAKVEEVKEEPEEKDALSELENIIKKYKVKTKPTDENSELLGIVKRLDSRVQDLQKKSEDQELALAYTAFMGENSDKREFVNEKGKEVFDKMFLKLDKKSPELWQDAQELFDGLTVPKTEPKGEMNLKEAMSKKIDMSKYKVQTGQEQSLFQIAMSGGRDAMLSKIQADKRKK